MDALTQEEEKALYIGKIDNAIRKLKLAQNEIEMGKNNPYIQGNPPSEIFNYVIQNLDNTTNNQEDEKLLYIGKIDQAIKRLTAAGKSIKNGTNNPYIQGTTPSEIFAHVIQNVGNPSNNHDGGGKKTKRRSTRKIKNKKRQNKNNSINKK